MNLPMHVGPGGQPVAAAKVLEPAHPGRGARLRRFFRRTPLEERVRILASSARVDITVDDDGFLEVRLTLANLARRRLVVDRFHCDEWIWNGVVLPGVDPHVRGIGTTIPGRGVAECLLTFQLAPGIVRRLRGATPPAPNRYTSVEARLEILGRLWFARHRDPVWVHVVPPNAEIHAPWNG